MKGSAYGYIFGLLIGVPLFAWGINYLFFKGNRATDVEINHYLQNSKLETFEVNKWVDEGYKQYIVALQRGANSAAIHWFNFYNYKNKKYYSLKTFSYLESNQQGTQRVYDLGLKPIIFIGYVNQNQLKNPKYGTKENPLPVWPKDLIEYDGVRATGKEGDNITQTIKTFHVNPETNRLFIGQYLSRFMDKEEYKEMFKK